MTDENFIRAPWTTAQVDNLNSFQRSGVHHEFTCGIDHEGDKTLYATINGWRCPHCEYQQDWAHRSMLDIGATEKKLPCDVIVPPATVIRKGCDMSVLFIAFKSRTLFAPEDCRFNDPAAAVGLAFNRPEEWKP